MRPVRQGMMRKSSSQGTVEFFELDLEWEAKRKERERVLLEKAKAIEKSLREVREEKFPRKIETAKSPPPSPDARVDGPGRYLIDTSAPQRTSCPHCFKELTVRELRHHLATNCTEKMVRCEERGCSAVLPKNEMKEHLKNGCRLAKKRRSLAAISVKRKEDEEKEILKQIEEQRSKPNISVERESKIEGHPDQAGEVLLSEESVKRRPPPSEDEIFTKCNECDELVRSDKIRYHETEECRYRKLYCPNRHLGCMEEIPICELNLHLKRYCTIEEQKEALVRRSRKRREEVKCPGCGESIELQYLRRHESTECPNRKVPCRNHHLGCNVVVRLRDRKTHEDVDNGVKPRPCLFFDGQDTHMAIEESDIVPPWTVEMWVYRPSLLESAKCHIREVKRIGKRFRDAIAEECRGRNKVLEMKRTLDSFSTKVATSGQGTSRTRGRANVGLMVGLGNVGGVGNISEITVNLARQLVVYEKAALETSLLGQLLFVAASTASAEIFQLQQTRSIKEEIDIAPKPTGKPCLKTYAVKSIDDGTEGINLDDMSTSDDGEIERKRKEVQKQMDALKKALESQQGNAADEDASGAQDSCDSADKKDQDSMPDGFELVKTNTERLDWSPKRWRDWEKVPESVLETLKTDQELLRRWRVETGLIRMTSEEKKGMKSGDEKDDEKKKKMAQKAAKREKREKNKRKAAKDINNKSNFMELFDNIKRVYSGSEPICFGPDACIYLNLCGACYDGSKKGKKASSNSNNESSMEDSNSKKRDVQGTLGFADKVEGCYSFNTKIPREKWTHVIVKCTRKPKKKIQVYSNSFLIGTMKDHYFNLPMQSIGSKHLSYHGYILDARYWAKDRSAKEMKFDMHCLLDLTPTEDKKTVKKTKKHETTENSDESNHIDKTGDRLIAWWTFEDGGHNKMCTDVTDNRFPSAIRGGEASMGDDRQTHWFEAASLIPLEIREQIENQRSILAEAGDKEEAVTTPPPLIVPMPSFLERNLCPFEVRRSKLAQRGRALMKESKCPLGCKERVRKVDVRFHVKHECERRLVKCRHKSCGKSFMAMDAAWHATSDDCAVVRSRKEILRLGDMDRKLFQCDLCGDDIQARHFEDHQENKCPHRMVKCPYPDCQKQEVPAHTLDYHLNVKCKSAAVRRKKMLITRARAFRGYARPWGISIRYDSDDTDTDDDL